MTTDAQNPDLEQFEYLKDEADNLLSDIHLSDIVSELRDTTERVDDIKRNLAEVRRRGYVFAAYLEQKTEVLSSRWAEARREAQSALDHEIELLRPEARQVELLLEKGARIGDNAAGLASLNPSLQSQVTGLERALSAARSRVESQYEDLRQDISQTEEQLGDIAWYLQQADEASFPFLAGEKLFLAAEAESQQTGRGKDDPDGIVYLTDQRLVFEQKETTGKKFGLFGGKKTQELKWEIPLHQIASVKAENKGLFGGKDLLQFSFNAGAPFSKLTVEVKGKAKSKAWAAQLERMIRGETNDERAITPDAETLESIRKAPTACPVCGATLPRVTAHEHQVTCGYCGTVIRI